MRSRDGLAKRKRRAGCAARRGCLAATLTSAVACVPANVQDACERADAAVAACGETSTFCDNAEATLPGEMDADATAALWECFARVYEYDCATAMSHRFDCTADADFDPAAAAAE